MKYIGWLCRRNNLHKTVILRFKVDRWKYERSKLMYFKTAKWNICNQLLWKWLSSNVLTGWSKDVSRNCLIFFTPFWFLYCSELDDELKLGTFDSLTTVTTPNGHDLSDAVEKLDGQSSSLTTVTPNGHDLSDAVEKLNGQSSIDSPSSFEYVGGGTIPSTSQLSFLRQARQKESRTAFLELDASASVASITETHDTGRLRASESEKTMRLTIFFL